MYDTARRAITEYSKYKYKEDQEHTLGSLLN